MPYTSLQAFLSSDLHHDMGTMTRVFLINSDVCVPHRAHLFLGSSSKRLI
jgi:hypothetical protein